MLSSRQAFGGCGKQRFIGSHAGNFDFFDAMDAMRFTSDQTFAGWRINFGIP
jgi:hypothetical protein